MQMTKEELDKLVADNVEKKMAEKAAEQKNALRAEMQEAFESSRQEVVSKGYKEEPAINKFAKLIRVAAAGQCAPDRMHDIAKKHFSDDKELLGYTGKALEAGVPTSGGFGIPQVLSSRVIEALYANTIIEKMGVSAIPMPNGRLDMTRMDTSASVGWVGELPAASPTAPVFGQVSLNAKKLYALSEISNTLLRQNAVGIDAWVAKDLQRKFRIELDSAGFYGSGTLYTPAGLANMAGIQTIGSSSTALTQTSPRDMIALLKAANVEMANPGWAMSPQMESWLLNLKTTTGAWIFLEEMTQRKTLCGYPYHVSTSISYTDTSTDYADLWLVDWDYFMWGRGLDMEIRMSQDASFVSGGVTYSALQRDSTIVRILGEHDFNIMQPKAAVRGTFSVA